HSETVQLLLYSGFDPKQKDKFGQTPLHLACLSGDLLTVEHVVDMDVEVNPVDGNGKTPIMLAVGRDHHEVMHFMQSKLNRFVKCSFRDIIFGPPGRSRGAMLFFLGNLFLWGYPMYFYDALPMTWESHHGVHIVFLILNVFMWVCLYFANSKDPGFLKCNTDDYDMSLRQVIFKIVPYESKLYECTVFTLRVSTLQLAAFFLFTVCVNICSVISLYFAVTMLRIYGFSFLYVVGFIEFTVVNLLMLALVLFQAHQITKNITTNERMNRRRYRYLIGPSGLFSNPFDRGTIKNCLEYFHWTDVPSTKQNLMYNV
ncbi:hypothetical protein QZH41_018815, partial [Actinostola sp. cb2023]